MISPTPPPTRCGAALVFTWAFLGACASSLGQSAYRPPVAPASPEAQGALRTFELPKDLEVRLFAAEPETSNPVAFWVDARGRCFVAETYRQEKHGVPDNRAHNEWLADDLAAQTVADRKAYYLKHHPDYASVWRREHDLVRLLEDRDGDGRADRSVIFADGFNDLLDGTGAGVLVRGRDVYYTCIPNLWRLRDLDDDGHADTREVLHDGFGVRVALRGHDLHGLCMGPDGRLYFSIGDRGYHITTPEGQSLVDPQSGAVFRCELDGSDLQVFATGLRNPQELAFDDFGNLFTGDNNCDAGDKARLVYVVEGGDTGWRMTFQYVRDRGYWMPEGVWKTRFEGQPAFHIPPLAHLTSGPSGLAFYPGTGLSSRYRNHFFLCDFLGSTKHSGVWSFTLSPEGAGFRLATKEKFLWNILATDVDFGPEGDLWVSDWVQGWEGSGRGRIYRVRSRDASSSTEVARTRELLTADFAVKGPEELAQLLSHPDRRVRSEAQWALAAKGPAGAHALAGVAYGTSSSRLAKLHAIWGLGQVGRRLPAVLVSLTPLLDHDDPEIRAQAIKVLGESKASALAPRFSELLEDPSPRVQYFAALALGRTGGPRELDAVFGLLTRNGDKDVYLRHAAVMALTWIGSSEGILARRRDPSSAVRLGALLALRRLHDARVAVFLDDADPFLRAEAARAIYDVPIPTAYDALATHSLRQDEDPALIRRKLGACDLLGDEIHARALATFALDPKAPEAPRTQALRSLASWGKPPLTDRVLNMHRPRPPRTADHVREAVRGKLGELLRTGPDTLRTLAARIAGLHRLNDEASLLAELVKDSRCSSETRQAALTALQKMGVPELRDALSSALKDQDKGLRAHAASVLAKVDAGNALTVVGETLRVGDILEQQVGLGVLARIAHPDGDAMILAEMERLALGQTPKALQVDVLDAARKRAPQHEALARAVAQYDQALASEDPMVRYLPALEGGNAERGKALFLHKTETNCQRCHAYRDRPSDASAHLAGPDLSTIGKERERRHLLESIVLPNREISTGYESVLVETSEEEFLSGRILSEDTATLTLEVVEVGVPKKVALKKSQITFRKKELSAMPEDLVTKLSLRELRDLIEYLTTQREP